jgi:GNAT superfamily N-acetyltransferase
MEILTLPVNVESLEAYSTVPIGFEVTSRLSVALLHEGLGGIALREEEVIPPYGKDYDDSSGEGPMRWLESFNTSNWVLFLAREGGVPVGGATVAFRTPEVHMLRGTEDMSVLWDIRVHPVHRRSGVGTALFLEAAEWSRQKECRHMKIETQNTNVPACRFYAKQGCRLGEINRYAYSEPHLAHEVMLVWYLDL